MVGHFSPESGITWDSSRPLVWHGSTYLDNGGDKNNGTNYAGTGDAFAPIDGRDIPVVPLVYSVAPSVITPEGGKVSITGGDFRSGVITVLIADKICVSAVVKSDTLIECNLPPGIGGPHEVIVTIRGVPSSPRQLVSYNLPHIHGVSQSWVTDGTLLRVKGTFFVVGTTRCRIEGHFESRTARYIDTSHIECAISFSKSGASLDRGGKLEVSNDDGQRWVSGVTLDIPVVWGGGKLNPASPRTVDFPKDVVIGGIIPTNRFSDSETQKRYIKDVTLAFTMAASAVNAAAYFPGDIQLRVEVLPVDPGGSGTPTTVTEVATAFAKQGVATNTSTLVGVHDPSKCREFGYPIHGEWQGDPGCCSVHAKAGCSRGYIKVKGSVCGSGSWGVAHATKCEASANAYPLTNVIGIAGLYWSSNAIPAARAVSNPFRLPMVSYDAWTSALDNATEFPYFVRVGPANSDISKVCGEFMRSMGWSRIAVVTDDDAYTNDFGKQVANDMKANGGTVLYHGVYPMVPPKAVVDKQGQLHKESVVTISSHLLHARAKGARIVFVVAKGNAGKIALYSSLQATGFMNEGYAIMVSLPHRLLIGILDLKCIVSHIILHCTTHTKLEPESLLRRTATCYE